MASMHITHPGKLVHECSVPGETRADDVFPAHSGGIQLSRDRFLFLFATRGWRGTDEDRSIIYQLHKDGFDGDVIQEGMVSQTREDWEPFGDGRQVVYERITRLGSTQHVVPTFSPDAEFELFLNDPFVSFSPDGTQMLFSQYGDRTSEATGLEASNPMNTSIEVMPA